MAKLKPIDTYNLSHRVYTKLRTALIEGQMKPGDRLRLSEVAEQLGVSITPVREAVFRLVSEKALMLEAGRTICVPVIGPNELMEIQRIRILLEGAAAELAAPKITDGEIETLEALQKRFQKAAAKDPKAGARLNREFHFYILEVAKMPILASTIENMWAMMGPLLNTFHAHTPTRDLFSTGHKHEDVIAALRRKDGTAAKKAIQADIRSGEVMVQWLDNNEYGLVRQVRPTK